ncbi:MAG: orotidine-5'-phosphate decarboxylase [Actinobacteria bacterium]|nr:orotidine-5'-phosphate decarboxylase [Actinomycetota bacterium]
MTRVFINFLTERNGVNFSEKLDNIIQKKKSLLCVGLDTVLERIPHEIRRQDNPLFAFNKAIIDATADFTAAYKVNTAFYEAYGLQGWQALKQTFDYLPQNTINIADAKRGDIGNTAKMYARALFDDLRADAITVNPLMGKDSVSPFLENPEKGVFFLCLTSNPGSADLQHFSDGKQELYERIVELVKSWNTKGNCGLVVGATHADELEHIRRAAPDLPFLIPGIGAQGGDLVNSVMNGTNANSRGALFNSSRAVIYASSDADFADAARRQAEATRNKLNEARTKKK